MRGGKVAGTFLVFACISDVGTNGMAHDLGLVASLSVCSVSEVGFHMSSVEFLASDIS